MKTFILFTLKMLAVVALCLFNPLTGLMLSQSLADDEDDDDDCEF
jgi:hypothetical protein